MIVVSRFRVGFLVLNWARWICSQSQRLIYSILFTKNVCPSIRDGTRGTKAKFAANFNVRPSFLVFLISLSHFSTLSFSAHSKAFLKFCR